jgi:anthranilate phosphoribosyltransferase
MALNELAKRERLSVENLIDIGDPYSGFNRSIPISSFLPPLLAELGIPTVIHGLDSVSPKFGLTHRHTYHALDQDVDLTITEAKDRIKDASIGWSYIDQSQYSEPLHALVPLRNKIIKRTVLNTVESLIGPIRGINTHSVLGYVHKPYPPIYANLAEKSGFSSSLLIRGVEGGVVPSLRQKGLMYSYYQGIEKNKVDIDPKTIGIKRDLRAISIPKKYEGLKNKTKLAEHVANLGLEALSGKKGMFYDGLLYSASLILWHLNIESSLSSASEKVRSTLDSANTVERL